jgi:hypothetical protein
MSNTLEKEVLTAIEELKTKLKDEIMLTAKDLEVLIIASILEEFQHDR